ncbi:pyridoxamine 5'-phosphate oxidase family protein [Xenorhabdus sp. Reich]|uniref:Pyridoxamine 5'-phosphate oxidase family protein n=1 Tax=Xenorhabdus littoralis TaxID=2582835 RepID=A0ABU4SJ51_9GAMM|nr:pyridoxamine 5'-phosphate oxidase family protein [Xenorhabdus sp. Reich]MDX7998681.1 pyridoxamine 5'-phosphate oxidase family protein [Xenorhabdus sp. Reich]
MNKHIQSSFNLLSNIRFFNLSTHDPDADSAWSSTLFYIPQYHPLKLIWYSKQNTRHSRELYINPRVSGTIYSSQVMPDSSLDLAGSQFMGYARQVPDEQLQETYDHFFLKTFPDENIRKKKARPISDYQGHAERRFYELEIQVWWVYDSDAWTLHKDDDRVQVPLSELLVPPMFNEK